MPKVATDKTKSRRYRKWYRRNKKRLLARRREKYQSDPKFRLHAIQRSRQRYWAIRPEVVVSDIMVDVAPSFSRRVNRSIESAYGLADVAKLFGRTARTVQFWIERGVLPKPLYRARERRSTKVYTKDEFSLLKKHAPLLVYPKKTLAESVFARTVRREMAYLRRGLLTIGTKETRP